MKKLNVIFTAALAALMMQACHNKTAVKDSVKESDSANAANDTSKKDTTSAVAAEVFDNDDAKFAVKAASGGLTEVLLGDMASHKSTNARIQQFGAMMVTDHTKANNILAALAKSKKMSLPTIPGNDDQKVIDDLSKKSGTAFDEAYVDDMLKDHENDIKLFQNEAKTATDTTIKAFAIKTLPVLHKHYDAIADIKKSLQIK
jgi:putative membrane protein